jgi:hypothetical protein
MNDMHLCCYEAKWLHLKLKTLPKQLVGSLALAFTLLHKCVNDKTICPQRSWRDVNVIERVHEEKTIKSVLPD